jgi:putative ABC transport system permease protein
MTNYLRTLLLFYRRHLRAQPMRELMAVVGVAAGVALLFAVQINSHSLTSSFEEIVHGIAGRATLEVASRAPQGFDERIAEEVEHMPGVRAAAPIFTTPIIAVGPKGSRSLTLVGATEELASLGGSLILQSQRTGESAVRRGLLIMTEPSARTIGAKPGGDVAIEVGARTAHIALDATIPAAKLGPLAESPIAAAPLAVAQSIAGLPGRVTRVLVEPKEGRSASLLSTLRRRYGATLNVRSVESEPRLLTNAAAPEVRLTVLFSAISLLVGVVLAYNALLLASEERRRFVVYLIETGTSDSMIIASLAFDAAILGIAGALLGLLVGDVISLLAFRALPGYLTAAFPTGTQRIIGWQTILIALSAGILAAFAAAALPAIAVLRGGAAAEPDAVGRVLSLVGKPRARNTRALTAGVGLALVCASICASLLLPAATIVALAMLVVGVVLCIPTIVARLLVLARQATRHTSDPSIHLAVAELRGSVARSVALFATGVIAMFLLVQIGGSIADVQRAVSAGAEQTGLSADLWVKPSGSANIYATQPFVQVEAQHRLEQLSVVRQVVPWRSSFLDLPNRRTWVIGIPPQAHASIAPIQLVSGTLLTAERRLREGGWAVISQSIANEDHVRLGQRFTLPTPAGAASFRLAATVHNYGWPSGTVLVNGEEYARLWHSTWASQLGITLAPHIAASEGKRAVEAALPSDTGLSVQTRAERQAEIRTVLSSTLSRLSITTTIVLIAAIVSVIAMMVAAAWQRRDRLEALLSIGMSFTQLARLIFYEGGSMLLGGCLLGLAGGIVAQGLADNWAAQTTDTQINFSPAWQLGARAIVIAVGVSVLASMIAVVRTVEFDRLQRSRPSKDHTSTPAAG